MASAWAAALPFGTILVIMFIWMLVTLPLTVIGGIVAQHAQSAPPPLGSAPARLLCLLRARLTALTGSALSGEKPGHWARNHRLGRPS